MTQRPSRPHPHLTSTVLHLDGLLPSQSDTELAELFRECLPIRLQIKRDSPGPSGTCSGTVEFRDLARAEKALSILTPFIQLSPSPAPFQPLPPSRDSLPRVVSGFPNGTTPGDVWEYLRPAAIRELRPLGSPGPGASDGPSYCEALVEFYFEDDARNFEVAPPQVSNGATLSITPFNPNRPRQFAHSELGSAAPLSIGAPAFVPNASVSTFSPQGQYADLPGPISPGPGQHVQPAPGSTSASGLIDFCNLYIKQIDPSISSNDLFNHFRSFGRIVSARVMRDELGVSKGFGFVSYQTPQEAHLALTSMDGAFMGSKQIVVRLHEPKKLRAEKLAEQRARGGSLSPKRASEALPGMALSEEHSRRSSGAGGAYLPTPPHTSPVAPSIESMAQLSLQPGPPPVQVLPSDEADASPLMGLDGISRPASTSPLQESERLLGAIRAIEPDANLAAEIRDMIVTLKKRERALCLFNADFLRDKVREAKEVIASLGDDDEDEEGSPARSGSLRPAFSTPQRTKSAPINPTSPLSPEPTPPSKLGARTSVLKNVDELARLKAQEIMMYLGEHESEISGSGIEKSEPAASEEVETFLASLQGSAEQAQKQRLGERLFKLLKSWNLPRGIRAPTVTIQLLDSEDLPSLARLAAEFPAILKEKVLKLHGQAK